MTVVPLALVALLWLLGRSSARRYQTGAAVPESGRPDDDPVPLLRADLWHAGVAGRRLRLLHVQIGILTVGAVLAVLFPASGLRTAAVLVSAASLLIGLACSPPSGWGSARASRPSPGSPVGCGGCGSESRRRSVLDVALVVAGASVGADAAGLNPDRLVRDADRLVGGLFKAQAVLLLAVLVLLVVARMRGAGRGREMFVKGYAAFYIAFLGWLLGVDDDGGAADPGARMVGQPGIRVHPGAGQPGARRAPDLVRRHRPQLRHRHAGGCRGAAGAADPARRSATRCGNDPEVRLRPRRRRGRVPN